MRVVWIACTVAALVWSAHASCPAAESVFGRVVLTTGDSGIAGATVILEGAGRRLELSTRGDGGFMFPGLPPGEYRVRAEKRGYVVISQPAHPVRLEANGCAEVTITAQPDRRIRGRVFNWDGKPAPLTLVTLLDASKLKTLAESAALAGLPSPPASPSAWADAEGRFEFKNLQSGEYYLGVNLDRPPSKSSPYTRYYYPGTDDRETARTIRVPEDATIIDADLPLPPEQAERTLSGVVVWPDGTPAVKATLYLEDPQFPWQVNIVQGTTDEHGLFTVRCYDRTRYLLHAVSACTRVPDCRSAEPYEVIPGVEPNLRLVLTRPGHSGMEAFERIISPVQ
jgi:Carboxypeptidase regulatory-like domain